MQETQLQNDQIRYIPLTQGKFAIVDTEDFERVNNYKWHYQNHGYALSKRVGFMHVFILGKKAGFEIDHINHNKLDNRKSNLRRATRTQNNLNRTKTHNHLGVTFRKSLYEKTGLKLFMVRIGKTYIGDFKDQHHAALAYDLWAKDVLGEFAPLNFKSAL